MNLLRQSYPFFILLVLTAISAWAISRFKSDIDSAQYSTASAPGHAMNVCRMDLSYSIGRIDPRFGIPEQDVIKSMEAAIALWAGAMETLNIRYAPEGGIIVNFEYDERQKLTERERHLMRDIDAKGALIDQLLRDYDRHGERMDQLSSQHRQLVNRIPLLVRGLNEWVSNRNQSGGLTQSDLEYYEDQKRVIEQMQQQESALRNERNAMVSIINPLGEQLNREIDEKNRLIEEYNRNYAGNFSFSSGTFEGRVGQGVITIYHHVNEQHRLLLLAHELGHALGLGHVSNPKSVMYKTIDQQLHQARIQLTEEDKEALRHQCR